MVRLGTLTAITLALALAAGCGNGKKTDGDADAGDGADVTDLADGDVPVDGEDVPADTESEDAPGDEVVPPPGHVLKYLGRYEHQDDGPDHLMGCAVLDAGPLVVASATGVAVVDALAVQAGEVTTHMGKYLVDTSEASNLDGAPAGSTYFPKFFDVVTRGSTAYVTTRYDGLWIFDVTGSGTSWTVSETRRLMRAREFTESAQIVGDDLFLTHHADGIEVLDLSTDPTNPTTVDTLASPLVDAWGISAQPDGKLWVADGAGGVKYVRYEAGTLTHVTGDTVTTSPGTAFDVAVSGTWVVAAMGGQGVTVYEEWTAAQRNTYDLPGVCVDVEVMGEGVFAVACRSWVHVIEVDELGLVDVLASARLHRRPEGTGASVHIGSHVTVDGDLVYVAGWDHLDVYRFMDEDPDADADIQLSGQRVQFGASSGTGYFHVWNGGQGPLVISSIDTTEASVSYTIDDTTIPPGGRTNLLVRFDGSASGVQTTLGISSNDPDDPELPLMVFADLAGSPDPGETAPDFTGPTLRRDYAGGTFVSSTLTLSDFAAAGEVVHFAVFGTWCPACLPALAAMRGDIDQHLPVGAELFVVDQGEQESTLRHVLSKTYIPIEVYLDADGSVGGTLYDQPAVGLPFGRGYVIDAGTSFEPVVTDVFTGYEPQAVLEAIGDDL